MRTAKEKSMMDVNVVKQKTKLIVRSPKGVLYKLVGDTLQIGDYSNSGVNRSPRC